MMKNISSKTGELLVMLQCSHSILNTAWPRPGCKELAGAGRFIHTKLFVALQNADTELVRLFQEIGQEEHNKKFAQIWHYCHEIISALKRHESDSVHPSIDSAFNLLYLATGVLYQKLGETLPVPLIQDKRFSKVEDFQNLISKCQWRAGNEVDLIANLNDSLTDMINKLR